MASATTPQKSAAEIGDRDATSCLSAHEFLIHQYDTLRGEILKNMEIESQIVGLTITIFGVILGLKVADRAGALSLLAYPAIALALSLLWSHHDRRSRELGEFIKDYIEQHYINSGKEVKLDLKGWESYLRREDPAPRQSYRISIVLIFLLTELSAIGVTIGSQLPLLTTPEGISFLVLAGVSFILTCVVLREDLEEFKKAFKKLHKRYKEFW